MTPAVDAGRPSDSPLLPALTVQIAVNAGRPSGSPRLPALTGAYRPAPWVPAVDGHGGTREQRNETAL
jgi:hypothetical protein